MYLYETGFLVAPNLTDEETEALIQQMAEVVSQRQGRMIRIEKWGKRRLAYPVRRYGEASYVFLHYEGGPEIPAELIRRFRQMDTVLRYLTMRKETQRNTRKKKKARPQAGPEEAAAPAVAPEAAAEPRRREET